MPRSTWIPIARTGTFTDSSGTPQTFTEADLAAIATAYTPKQRDAPLVFGHPTTNAPAFGWVKKLKAEGGKLLAQFALVPGEVRDLVAKGHYRHVSMSLMPDRVTLRHVGLLGAAQPAIDGLGSVELAATPGITINFSNEAEHKEDSMTVEELQRQVGALTEQINTLKAENAKLKTNADGAESQKGDAEKKAADTAADFAAYKAEVVNTAREKRVLALVNSGRLEPCKKDETLSFASALAEVKQPVNFSSGSAGADGKPETVTAEEHYFRELESRAPSPLNLNFAAFAPAPAHARQERPVASPADMIAKM